MGGIMVLSLRLYAVENDIWGSGLDLGSLEMAFY